MRNKRAKEIKRKVKEAAGGAVEPATLREAKRDYTLSGSRNSQKPKLKTSKRQQRLTNE